MAGLPPSRRELVEKLSRLIAGSESREDVADWATAWVSQPDSGVDDEADWLALTELSGADLQVAPGRYLHGERDFAAWLERLVAQGSS